MRAGFEPIDDDEILYRRVRFLHFDRNVRSTPDPEAMRPIEEDSDGLSLRRARYWTVQQIAEGRPGKKYYVAHLRARDVRSLELGEASLTLKPDDPTAADCLKGHCVIPELVYATRRSDLSESFQRRLAGIVFQVDGPFETPA